MLVLTSKLSSTEDHPEDHAPVKMCPDKYNNSFNTFKMQLNMLNDIK